MRKQLEAALRDSDIGLVETQKLDRDGLAALRTPAAAGASSGAASGPGAGGRAVSTAGALADELEPGTTAGDRPSARRGRRRAPRSAGTAGPGRRGRLVPWLAVALAVMVGGGAAAALVMKRTPRFHATVEIGGVALTAG